ncbi:MAG: FG-GAP-like repeat-containing protein [Candidatus Electryonea clarkiae]|nr:FG-GAP-like repeat-containing protein [Candidatus Electryonea clarkiae]MDP8288598.1 FG-GAP-like repeat-containing protein [Candidatus Electryonea clarkiae]
MKFEFKYNKHCLLAFAIFSLEVWVCFAQINFTEHTIADNFEGAYHVFAIDLDGDSDMDVLGAANVSDDITWWENDGEQGFTEHTIDGDFNAAHCVYATDIDNDSDMDVLGASTGDDDITWWENDGEQDFTEHRIDGNFIWAWFVYAADVDSDGDMDVLGASHIGNEITWWENDGEQDFTEHTITRNFFGASSVYAEDMDGDGDMDVLGTAFLADENIVIWWENDGEQDFTEHIIAENFEGSWSAYAADIDSDGDMDVLGSTYYENDIIWWENDGEQDFTEHTIADNFEGPYSVYATDMDDDGDIDILGAARGADDITWWENDGEQDFTEHTIEDNYDYATSVYATDIDGDDDMDVLGSSYEAGELTWWESDLDPLRWRVLPDSGFLVNTSLELSWEYLYNQIRSVDFPDEDLIISVEDGEQLFVELDDDGLTITSDEDWTGNDSLMLTVTDPTENTDTTYQHIKVFHYGWTLPDSVFFEDDTIQLSMDYLYRHLHMSVPYEELVIVVENGNYVYGELGDDGMNIFTEPDWNGLDSLMLIATDPDENSDTTFQRLTVYPVNDPPTAFTLITPADEAVIGDWVVDFQWENASNPWEMDTTLYTLRFRSNARIHLIDSLLVTDYTDLEIESLGRWLGFEPGTAEYEVEWRVSAVEHSGTISSDANFTFIIPMEGVDTEGKDAIPDEFSLIPIFPNPFNPSTIVTVSLPSASLLYVKVFNTLGQQVAILANELYSPGYHQLTFNADELPSGIYFIHASVPGKMDEVRKVVLIK